MEKKYYILMGDVVKSSQYKERKLQDEFRSLIEECNIEQANGILSPYTITLGDEFQGVAKDLLSAIKFIFYMEEIILRNNLAFKIRYVLHQGQISTPLNKINAHGMLGKGLVEARKMLSTKRRNRPKYQIDLEDRAQSKRFNDLFYIVDGLSRGWSQKDFALIFDMLQNDSNSEIAKNHGKNRSQIWKRRKKLFIHEYNTIKYLIFDMIINR